MTSPSLAPLRALGRLAAACALVALVAVAAPALALDGDRPAAEIPMYGSAAKTSEAVQADERLLQETMDRGFTRDQVVRSAIDHGWAAFQAGDYGMAMRRFNQAWLLDPQDGRVFWGFAVTVEARDEDLLRANGLLAKARALLPDDAALMVESGRLLARIGRMNESIDLFKQALELDPDFGAAERGLAISYAYQRDFERALFHAERAEARGERLPAPFMRTLREEMQ